MAMVAAALTQDQPMSRAQAAGRAIGGDGLVEHKISAECERFFHACDPVGNSKDNGFGIGLSAPHFPDDLAAALDVIAINKHGVEFAASNGLASCVGGGNRL